MSGPPRRHPGGGGGGGGFDIEALQRDNDAGVDALAERVGLLKSATAGIRGEVEAQHSILDRMADSMGSTRGVLGSAASKFKVVMADKSNRSVLTMAGGIAGALLLLYILLWKR